MKRSYLFPKRAAKIQSRQIGLHNFVNAAYRSDGDVSEETKALLAKVKETLHSEIESRNFTNAEQVKQMMNGFFEGMSVDALRNFNPDEFKSSLTKVAAEVEKLQARDVTVDSANKDHLKELLERKADEMESVYKSKDPNKHVILNARAAAVMTTGNTIDSTAVPDDILESFKDVGFVEKRRPRQYVYDLADRRQVAEVEQYITWMEEGDEEGAFAIVAQGAVKPLVSLDLVRNVSQAKKVAGKYVVTEEFAKFRKRAYQIIRRLIERKAERDYSAILTADLMADAASYVGTALDGQYTDPTDYHAIGAVAAQIQSLNFIPDLLILNPQDMWRIGLQQNTQGSFYLPIPMFNPAGEMIMMGFTVRTSNYLTPGNFILGESGLWQIEDEAWTIRMGYGINVTTAVVSGTTVVTGVTSDFDTNQFRVIVEKFFHNYFATADAGSFVYANFNTVKAALEVTP